MANIQLSKGALERMVNDPTTTVEDAILQVLNYRAVADNKGGEDRYRLMISDGVTTHGHVMILSPVLLEKVRRGQVEKFTVIKVKKYVCNKLENNAKAVLIIQDFDIVAPGSEIKQRIENPVINTSDSFGSAGAKSSLSSAFNAPSIKKESAFKSGGGFNRSASSNHNIQNQVNYNVENSNRMIDPSKVCPIDVLTPYYNAWTIKARVTTKGSMKTWSKATGEGKLFSFEVTDSKSEIRITAFNKEADKFFDIIQIGKVYYISKGQVKTANKKFNPNSSNEYEVTLTSDTVIQPAEESDEIPKMRYKFVEIKDLENQSKNATVDVIGICKFVGELNTVVSKTTNRELKKREIIIADKSAFEVRFTIWGEQAENFDAPINSIIAIKNALVGEFNGKTLSTTFGSTNIQVDPDIPEAHLIKGWFMKNQDITFNSLSKAPSEGTASQHKFISQINSIDLSTDHKIYSIFKATIISVGKNPLYKSCGVNGCNKKVRDENNGMYHCDKCNVDSPTYGWRMILSLSVSDCTGQIWLTAFQENAEQLLGIKVDELSQYHEMNDTARFNEILASICFKPIILRVSTYVDTYNNERKLKTQIYKSYKVDPVLRSRNLLKIISNWTK